MIAHVMISEKFMPPFISLMEQEFSRYNHQYLFITSEKYEFGLNPSSNIRFFHTADDFKLVDDILIKADKIILHGLWREKINLLLLTNPALLKKSYWVMWGGDFYFPERHSKAHHNVIKKVGYLVTGTIGEIDLVRKWYGAEGEHVSSYVYTSNIVDDELPFRIPSNSNAGMHILAGNSAAQTNNHLFILEQLRPHKDRIAKLIVPLSYADSGDKEYVTQVISQGKKFFGESFTPLTQFLKLDEYNALLATIDIAVFAHNRQQGMGNIIHLLGLGIKVFMQSNITVWDLFKELNIKVYDVNKFDLMPIDLMTAKKNNEGVKKHFSQATLIGQLEKVLN
jgi:dTDP-N-acetylfucosamine:lipid II N-acetylfucosaminyltransferase